MFLKCDKEKALSFIIIFYLLSNCISNKINRIFSERISQKILDVLNLTIILYSIKIKY